MEFTKFEKQFLVDAILKDHKRTLETIQDHSDWLSCITDNPDTVKALKEVIAIYSHKAEALKALADKLGLDIKFL